MPTQPKIGRIPGKLAACFTALLLLCSCTEKDQSLTILQNAGFTEIKLTGYRWLGCAKDDDFHTGFEAKGGTGKLVTGVVCFGFTTGTSIRIDSPK